MQFRTSFDIPPFEHKISHQSKLLAIGSCFSDMIGEKLLDRKFNVLNNPFGTIFNPLSLSHLLKTALSGGLLDEELVVKHQDRFFHYQAHSHLSATGKAQLLELIQNKLASTKEQLTKASHIFMTFGTAFIYEMKNSGKPLANCHKQPNFLFNKKLIKLEEMMEEYRSFHQLLHQINPAAKIIVTVSPVRHIKDGIPENQVSKSLLRYFCHQLQENFQDLTYFPSYELMMDDLRDYRFYKDDMIHPTSKAEKYIWDQFQACFMAEKTIKTSKTIEEIKNSLNHQPFHPESHAHQQFLQNLLQKMERLTPEFDFSREIEEVKNKLARRY